jgi:hypothetical protein
MLAERPSSAIRVWAMLSGDQAQDVFQRPGMRPLLVDVLDVAVLRVAAQYLAIAIHLAQLDFRMLLIATSDDQTVDLLAFARLDRKMKLQHNTFSQCDDYRR